MEDDGNRLFPGIFVLALRHGLAVHTEDVPGTYCRVGYFDMCVTGGQHPGHKDSLQNRASLSDNVLFHISLIL